MNNAIEQWSILGFGEQLFWSIALFSSVLFSFQFVMGILGMDGDSDIDSGGIDTDGTGGDFAIFSLRSIISFFLFFGWTGVLMIREGLSMQMVIIVSFLVGLAAMMVVAYILSKIYSMSETGTVDFQDAIGQSGTVYLPIPAELSGKGKILIKIEGKTMELTAVSAGKRLETNQIIRIVDILDNNIFLVESNKKLKY